MILFPARSVPGFDFDAAGHPRGGQGAAFAARTLTHPQSLRACDGIHGRWESGCESARPLRGAPGDHSADGDG